ncbi:MAG TPA: PAS domain S-box protein [Stellaceae bacterium]|nr:PAS domain S-box protein [Stellaceae bacterium]
MTAAQYLHTAFLLVQNAALLSLGVIGYYQIRRWLQIQLPRRAEHLLYGAFFGLLGLVSMYGGIQIEGGVRLDLRNVLVVLATVFGGMETGAVALAVVAAARFALGGSGVVAAFLSAALAFALSVAFVVHLRRRKLAVDIGKLALLGIAVGLSGLVGVLFFPRPAAASRIMLDVFPPWLVLTTLTLVFIGAVILAIEQTRTLDLSLGERERELQAIMDNAPLAIFLKDRQGRYRLVNRTYAEWSGRRPEDLYGRESREVYPSDMAKIMAETDHEVLTQGRVSVAELAFDDAENGQAGVRHTLTTKFPIRDESGAITGLAGFRFDITDRKRAEVVLRESEALLAESQRLGGVGYILADLVNGRIFWSDSLFELRRVPRRDFFTPDEAIAFIHPDDRATYYAARNAAVAERRDFELHIRVIRGDGTIGWEHSIGHPRYDRDGNLVSLLVVLRDVTDAMRSEAALRASEERFRALVEYSATTIFVFKPDGTMIYRSPSRAASILGFEEVEVIGQIIFDRVHPDDAPIVTAAFQDVTRTSAARANGRSRVQHKDGTWRYVDWSVQNAIAIPGIEGIVVNAQDVTAAVKLEQQLLQAQKMEAIGQLAGGIAHDFNNIMGAILGFAGFLLQDLPPATSQYRFAQRIVKAGEAARELVRQILAFSRLTEVERDPHDIVRIAQETGDMLRGSLAASSTLEVTVPDEALVAVVNAAQIGQILLNLTVNAQDALRGEPGVVAIGVSRVRPGDADHSLFAGDGERRAAEGDGPIGSVVAGRLRSDCDYARITVRDTGVGMDPPLLEHIFDPFFTTKQRSRGTGLGLAVVHGAVMAYGGALIVTSTPGRGSEFAIYLPLSDAVAVPGTVPVAAQRLRGRERILVIDDDVDLTDMLSIGLDRLGYEVVALNDPDEGIAVVAESPGAWDVVISDQAMPGLKGIALLERIKQLRPALRVILCTGYSDGATEAAALAAGIDAFFLKPVLPEQIAGAIRRLVDGPSAAA